MDMDIYRRIGLVCSRIPRGRVATYGQIALLCGKPGNSRQVGYALKKGLAGENVPAHRVVNAAGILRMGATDQLSAEDWQQTFAVNVGGAFNLFQQTMAQFRRQRGGAIVTVASDAAHTPRIGMSAYGASKAALKSLALTVGLELAGSGVRCNLVSPGSTDTDMQRTLWVSDDAEQQRIRGFGEQFKLGIPLGKIARPQEIANTILFLASSHASHITLQDIVVDGGSTLGA